MMSGETQEIKIVGVDKDKIVISSDKKEYWVVSFTLSSSPDASWQKKFYDVQQKDASSMKRKAQIVENSLNVDVPSSDDLQKVLDDLKIQVAKANVLCEEDYQTKMKVRQELEDLQQRRKDSTQKFKDDSDKLIF